MRIPAWLATTDFVITCQDNSICKNKNYWQVVGFQSFPNLWNEVKKEVYNNSCYSYSIIVALWEIKLKLRIYLTFRMIRHTCSALMFCIVRDYEKGLSRFNKTSMLKMYVGTYEMSSKVNFVFQHAFYCHVYHRSLRFISYKFQSS